MRKDKEKAIQLRRQGMSYKKIRAEIGVPIATLSDWFKRESWSFDIKNRLASDASLANPRKLELMVRATKQKWQKIHQQWKEEAIKEFPKLKNNPLFMAGLMLYWGEGDKKLENGQVSVSNSDPHLIRLFYLFLTKVTGTPLERISLRLLLYPDLIDNVQKNLWSRATKIHPDRFKKSTTIQGRHPTKRNSYGVCIIKVSSRQLKEKVIKWLDLSQQYFNSKYDTGVD
ncbi:MAG: helix-turn-helix domain-containing protein [bacterium]|nr:helix-turn-helix domain-containing protein [bacterium]